jgi:cyclic beta-1,2-glucan synthetase
LQDVMALVYSRPDVARRQIVLAAAHQFKEGDVQHWWHPPSGRGVRTRISDDLVWLPFVTSFYINVTATRPCWTKSFPSSNSRNSNPEEHEELHATGGQRRVRTDLRTLRASARSQSRVGKHGLPLMGRRLERRHESRRHKGKGESVWLGWFLYMTLAAFTPHVEARKNAAAIVIASISTTCKSARRKGWDGDWYRRAYFDDGTPLGSARNEECRIDSIAQSWSVISGASDPYRMGRAMAAVEEYLIRRGDGLVILSRRRSTKAVSIRVTSRVTFRVCARTAGSTLTPRSGP